MRTACGLLLLYGDAFCTASCADRNGPALQHRGHFVNDRVMGLEGVGNPRVMSSVTSASAVDLP